MKVEILAVGTELLLGQIANTNAQTMSLWLAEIGVDVMFHTTVGDNEERIAASIQEALQRSDGVIITGGLGPTHDDLTREAIARATSRPLHRDATIEEWLKDRFASMSRQMAPSNLRQADIPEGAQSIPNPRGTAPGIALDVDGRLIFAVPGVPSEMEHMMKKHVIPRLAERTGGARLTSRVLKVAGIGESDLAQRIAPVIERLEDDRSATIALLASPSEVKIRISAKAGDEASASRAIEPIENDLRDRLGELVYGVDDDTLEAVVGKLIQDRKLKLAVAESFTGGMLVSRLVDAPGTSEFLTAGFVTYSNESKIRDLGMDEEVIRSKGAVSSETAIAMAEGVRTRAGSDIGLATTGEAGPGPIEEPVGTMFLALSWEGGHAVRHLRAPGGRSAIRTWGTTASLNMLRLWLLGKLEAS